MRDADQAALLDKVPTDGTAIGNQRLREALGWVEKRYEAAREVLVTAGTLSKGQGLSGSLRRSAAAGPIATAATTSTAAQPPEEASSQPAAPARAPGREKASNQTANLGFEAKLWLTADKLRNNMDAAEYLALRGIEADFGTEQADTLRRDLHADLRADYVLANKPFNDSDWFRKGDDVRWQFGVPSAGNANFAWVQHFIHHLAPNGMAGFVLANGSMSSNQSGEGEIRKAIIEADLVDCMVALPGQLFYSTQIPV